jgi:hypothetical protein
MLVRVRCDLRDDRRKKQIWCNESGEYSSSSTYVGMSYPKVSKTLAVVWLVALAVMEVVVRVRLPRINDVGSPHLPETPTKMATMFCGIPHRMMKKHRVRQVKSAKKRME